TRGRLQQVGISQALVAVLTRPCRIVATRPHLFVGIQDRGTDRRAEVVHLDLRRAMAGYRSVARLSAPTNNMYCGRWASEIRCRVHGIDAIERARRPRKNETQPLVGNQGKNARQHQSLSSHSLLLFPESPTRDDNPRPSTIRFPAHRYEFPDLRQIAF